MSRFITVATEKNEKNGEVGKKVTNNNTKRVFYVSNIKVPQLENYQEVQQHYTEEQITSIINELLEEKAVQLATVPLRTASEEKLNRTEGKEKEYVGADALIAEGLKAAENMDFKALLGRAEGVHAKAKKLDAVNAFRGSEEYQQLVAAGDFATLAARLEAMLETR